MLFLLPGDTQLHVRGSFLQSLIHSMKLENSNSGGINDLFFFYFKLKSALSSNSNLLPSLFFVSVDHFWLSGLEHLARHGNNLYSNVGLQL